MKKIFIFIFLLIFCLFLAGCTTSEIPTVEMIYGKWYNCQELPSLKDPFVKIYDGSYSIEIERNNTVKFKTIDNEVLIGQLTYEKKQLYRIEIKIISENFDNAKHFAKFTSSQFDNIMMADSSLNKENILVAFLYILSYIGCRKRKEDGSDYESAKDNPEAFFKSIKHMSEELSMSKDTINQCMEYLTKSTDEHDALLIKREVGSVQPDKSKPPQNIPNIYVLNKEGYEQEIKWAIDAIIKLYKTDEFYPFVKGNNQKEKN